MKIIRVILISLSLFACASPSNDNSNCDLVTVWFCHL